MSENNIIEEGKKKLTNKAKAIISGGAALGIASIVATVSVVCIGGSDNGAEKNVGYTVSISSEFEGFEDTDLTISEGTRIKDLLSMIASPVPGYKIEGFYRDILCTDRFADDELVGEDTKIFIKFDIMKFTVRAYLDTSKTVLLEEKEVEYNRNANLSIPTKEADKVGRYEFVGWVDCMGKEADLSDIDRDMEVFAKFRVAEYNLYEISDIPNGVTITRGVGEHTEILTTRNRLHYGDRIYISYTVSEGHKVTNYNVEGATAVEEAEGWYTVTGDLKVTFEQERLAFVVGELQQGVTIIDSEGNQLSTGSPLLYGDTITINIVSQTGYHITAVDTDGLFPIDGFIQGKNQYTVRGDVSIKFDEEINTVLIKYFDYDGTLIGTETVSHGSSIQKEDPTRPIDSKIGTYKFLGWNSKSGEVLNLQNMQILEHDKTIEAYAKYELEYVEYGLSFSSGVTVKRDGEIVDQNTILHFGDELVVTYALQDHYHMSEFKYNGVDISENGATIVVTGNVEITFVELQNEYTIAEFPQNVKIVFEGRELSSNDTLHYGDLITITYSESEGFDVSNFAVVGATDEGNNTYRVTGNLKVIYQEINETYEVVKIPDGVTVLKDGKQLSAGDEIKFNDKLVISYTLSEGHHLTLFKVNGEDFENGEVLTVVKSLEIDFEESINTYKVVFMSEDKTQKLGEVVVDYNTSATFSEPTKESDNTFNYLFSGWVNSKGETVDLGSIKDNLTVYASFESEYIKYSLTVPSGVTVLRDGEPLSSESEIHFGDELIISYTETAGFHMTKFSINGNSVENNASFVADGNVVIEYQEAKDVYFVNLPSGVVATRDGAEITGTTELFYGDVITITYTLSEYYHLASFKVNGTECENNAVITVDGNVNVEFEEEINSVTIYYVDHDGLNIGVEIVEHGKGIKKENPTRFSDPKIGKYNFAGWLNENGEVVDLSNVVVNEHKSEITVKASYEFVYTKYSVTIPEGITVTKNGEEISSESELHYGDELVVSYSLQDHFHLGEFKINGVVSENNATVVVEDNIVIEFTELQNEYSLVIPENVTVVRDGETLTSSSVVHYGDQLVISFTEDEGYIKKVFTVNGVSFVNGDTFVVKGNVEIDFVQELRTYIINIPNQNVSIGTGGGNISDGDSVKYGDEIMITITADVGHHITGVYVNGEMISDGSSGTWIVTGEVNITYTQEKNQAAVVFFDDDKTTVISTITAEHGDSLAIADPTKAEDDYIYTFVGWVNGDGNFVNINDISILDHNITINVYAKYEAEYKYGYLNFDLTSDGTAYEVIGLNDNSVKDIFIPATYNGKNVVGIRSGAFENNSNLKTAEISYGMLTIGSNAFKNSGLTSIFISNTVISIEENAFANCTALKTVVIRSGSIYNNLTSLEACGGLIANAEEISVSKIVYDEYVNKYFEESFDKAEQGDYYVFTLPYEVEISFMYEEYEEGYKITGYEFPNVDWNTFDQNKITRLEIPDTHEGKPVLALSNIGGFEGLKSIKLPSNLRVLEDAAISYCPNLKSINLPSTLTTIGLGAFDNIGITSLVIPASVTSIRSTPDSAWSSSGIVPNCKNLTSLIIEEGNTVYTSRDASGNESNCIIEIASSTLIEGISTTIIPSNVTAIADYAFKEIKCVNNLILPSSIESIGSYAFKGSSGVVNLELSDKVVYVGESAFQGCSSLKTVTIAGSLTQLSMNLFAECRQLNSVVLREGVEEISDMAITNCENLESVILPSTLKSIGANAFSGCLMLRSIELNEGLTTISDFAFNGTGLNSIEIPMSVENLGSMAFGNCEFLYEAYVKANITELNGVFTYCFRLNYVELPETLTTIGNGEFDNTAFREFKIPAGVTKISASAFYNTKIFTIIFEGDPNSITFEGYNPSGMSGSSLYENATTFKIPTQFDNGSFSFGDSSKTFIKSSEEDGYSIYTMVFGQEELNFVDNGEGGYLFAGTDYNSKLPDIVIPDTYNGKPVVGVADNSIDLSKFRSVTFGNNIKKLQKNAFTTGATSALSELYIPASLTEIEAGAIPFYEGFEKIVVSPENPVYTSRDLSGNEYNCIIDKNTKTLIAAPYSSSTLNCPTDGSVEVLGEYFFMGCRMSDLIIPNCIKVIKKNCFGDSVIQRLYISESVEVIEDGAFVIDMNNMMLSIKNIEVSPNNKYFTSRDKAGNEGNCIIHISTKTLIFTAELVGTMFDDGSIEVLASNSFFNQIFHDYMNGSDMINFVIPQGIKKICGFALFNNSGIGLLTVPSSVTVFEDGAFAGINCNIILSKVNAGYTTKDLAGNECGCLIDTETKTLIAVLDKQNYYLPDDGLIENIGAYSLQGCSPVFKNDPETGTSTMEEFTLPSSVKKVNKYGFAGANGLISSVNAYMFLNEGLEIIEDYAFMGLQFMSSVILPSSLKYISPKAFENASSYPDQLVINSTEVYESLIVAYKVLNLNGEYYYNQTSLGMCKSIRVLKSADTGTNENLKSYATKVTESGDYYVYTLR